MHRDVDFRLLHIYFCIDLLCYNFLFDFKKPRFILDKIKIYKVEE